MPSSILVGSTRVHKPGFYGKIDATALGGKGISVANLALVGLFPQIEHKKPTEFLTAKALSDLDPADLDLGVVANLAFSPARDDRIPGGAQKVFLLNVQPVTQASYTFDDVEVPAAGSLVLKSKLWGTKGNQTFVRLNTNASSTDGLDVKVVRAGVTETFANLQSGAVFEIKCDPAVCTELAGANDTTSFSTSPTSWKWAWKKRLTAMAGNHPNRFHLFQNTNIVIDGKITCTLTAAANNNITVTVAGINKAGVPKTLTLTIPGGQAGPLVVQDTGVDALWSSLTSVKYETTNVADDAYAGQLEIDSNAFDLDPALFQNVGEMVTLINQSSAKGFKATAKHPQIGSIPAKQIDKRTSVNVKGVAATFRADLWAIVEGLAGSTLVEASRATNADLPPKHSGANPATSEEVMLLGGTATTPVQDSDWESALVELEGEDVQVGWANTDSVTVGAKLITHCNAAALAGYERNFWMGATKDKTAQQVYDSWTSALNTRHLAVQSMEVKVATPAGALAWKDPVFGALIFAGIQCGGGTDTSPTDKRPNLFDVRGKWTPSFATDNDAISKGIACFTRDELGIKTLRDVTTYLTDDNPAFSSVFANQSVNTSIRRLRGRMKGQIGDSTAGISAKQFKAAVEDELRAQVADGVIKAFKNVVIEDLGDRFRINYNVAPAEALYFVEAIAHVYRANAAV